MLKKLIVLIAVFLTSYAITEDSNELDVLPKLFHFNESEVCPEEKYFCRIHIKLRPADENNPSEVWKAIERRNNDIKYNGWNYDRSYMFRGYCLDDIENLEKAFDENFTEMGVLPSIDFSYCKKYKNVIESLDGIDVLFLFVMSIYLSFVIYSTIKTYQYSKLNPDDYHFEKMNNYVKTFSVLNSWRLLVKDNPNEDYKRLSMIPGIRDIFCLFIIAAHNISTHGIQFSHNPEFVDELVSTSSSRAFIAFFVFALQGFFVLSSFLFAIQLQNIVDRNGKITLKDISFLIMKRFLRYFPALILINLTHRNEIAFLLIEPIYMEFLSHVTINCKKNWWVNFLFIQNLNLVDGGICHPGTWYIAAETQLYCLTMFLFYLSRKYGISLKYLFGTVLAVNSLCHYYFSVTSEIGSIYHFGCRNLMKENVLGNEGFKWLHAATYIYLGSYLIGFVFGLIYTRKRNVEIFNTFTKKLLWGSSILVPVFFTTSLYFVRQSVHLDALKAVFFRPLVGLAYAIAILGMATNTGGWLKNFLGWKPFVIFSNFTFFIYIFHFDIILLRAFNSNEMVHHNYPDSLKSLLFDTIVSFSIGAIVTFLFIPLYQLQNILLQKLNLKKGDEKTKEN